MVLAIFVARLQECSEIRSAPATSKVGRAIRISNLPSDGKGGWLCHEEDRWERYVLIVPIRLSNQEFPDFSREVRFLKKSEISSLSTDPRDIQVSPPLAENERFDINDIIHGSYRQKDG
jgi:hypothetical protein